MKHTQLLSIFITVFCFFVISAKAESNNIMVLHDISELSGDIVTLKLEIINNEEFVGFNLDIPIPPGFTYIQDSAKLLRKTNHIMSFSVNPAGVAKIIAFSITNDAFPENDGFILSFDLKTPSEPGEYLFEIVNAIIGNKDAEDILTGTLGGLVTLGAQ